MDMPTVSVIVPVYRAEITLRRCVDSIIRQTYDRLEIILVDDGSPDGSGAICDAYAAADSRVTAVHRVNGGPAAARNEGLARASGAWLGFVDSDDHLDPDMYGYLLDLARRCDADIVQCGIIREETGRKDDLRAPDGDVRCALGPGPFPEEVWRYLENGNCSKLFRREVVAQTRFREEYTIGEDLRFGLDCLVRARSIAFGAQAKYHYVQHAQSLCHSAPTWKSLTSFRHMFLQAEQDFAARADIVRFCRESRLRDDLDICSRSVCGGATGKYPDLLRTVRGEMRELWNTRFADVGFTGKERAKCFLIGYAWPVYRTLLPAWKRVVSPDG